MRSYDYLKIKTKEEKRKRVYKTSQWQKWKNKVFIFAKISAIESQGKKKKKKNAKKRIYMLQLIQSPPPPPV